MVEVLVDNEVPAVLHRIETRARNLRAVLPVLRDALIAAVSDVYDAEGPGWPPLAASTLRKRRGGGSKILQDTGLMAQTAGAIGADYVEAFSPASYAVFHASDGPRSKIPLRNPFDLGPFEKDFLADAEAIVTDELVK